jgi:DNA topoisomerase-1
MKLDQGVDFETYKPLFEFQPSENGFKSKKTLMKEIDEAAVNTETIFIATDPDREGEVIADNIFQSLSKSNQSKVKRISFDAITKTEILKAIEAPGQINDD